MKNLLYIIAFTALITSCKSIEKMIDSGNYEEAYRYAIDKLTGEKNKKTKYVKALEKAYHNLNEQDLKEITRLQSNGSVTALARVVNTYERMEARQIYISPLLPLISQEGYLANIKQNNFLPQIITAQKKVSDLHFAKAEATIIHGRLGHKQAARQAYEHYNNANLYFDNYRGAEYKMHEAYDLGQTYILIENYVPGNNGLYYHASSILNQYNANNINTLWRKYVGPLSTKERIDYIATIEIEHINSGTERERHNSFTETKKVVTGQKKVPKKKQTVDTVQQYTIIDIETNVTAQVDELFRKKSSELHGRITVIQNKTQQHISTIPLTIAHLFEDYALKITGDQRALVPDVINRHKDYCAPFPSDYDMVTVLTESFSRASIQALQDLHLQ